MGAYVPWPLQLLRNPDAQESHSQISYLPSFRLALLAAVHNMVSTRKRNQARRSNSLCLNSLREQTCIYNATLDDPEELSHGMPAWLQLLTYR